MSAISVEVKITHASGSIRDTAFCHSLEDIPTAVCKATNRMMENMGINQKKEAGTIVRTQTCDPLQAGVVPTSKLQDMVNKPAHYNQGNIETIDAIEESMSPEGFQDYCKGNVMKYIWRWRDKGGVEDLKKAQWYLARCITSVEKDAKKS